MITMNPWNSRGLCKTIVCCISLWICFACDSFKTLERLTIINTGEVLNLAYNQTQINGEIVDLAIGDSLLNHGHCWDTLPQPTLNQLHTQLGERQVIGTFTSDLPELKSNTVYYARAFYIIRSDTLYSHQISFQTLPNPNLPFLLSISAFNISTQQAQIQSRFERLGTLEVVRYGHCWNTAPSPSINNQSDNLGTNPTPVFASTLTGLSANTEYFVRAYCQVNEGGTITTIYSQEIRFRTARE